MGGVANKSKFDTGHPALPVLVREMFAELVKVGDAEGWWITTTTTT